MKPKLSKVSTVMADAKPCTKTPWEKYTDSKISKKDLQKEFYSRIF